MNAPLRNLLITAAVAAAFLAWTFAGRRQAPRPPARPAAEYRDFEGIDQLTSVAILRFYTVSGSLDEGQPATLCYGVAKARAVRLDPPVEKLSPSLNRCFQVKPAIDTRYTLTAEGEDGRTVSESLMLQVKLDPLNLPKVRYFIARKQADGVHSLCFGTENAVLVSVDPPVIPTMHGAPLGCFYVAPKTPTSYTLTVTGAHGRTDSRKLTVSPDSSGQSSTPDC